MSWLAYETCKTCGGQVYNGSISNTAKRLEFQSFDTAPHIRRRVRPSHTSDALVRSVDARGPDAFYGYLRSPVRQLSARQFPLDYLRGVLYTIIGAWLSNPPISLFSTKVCNARQTKYASLVNLGYPPNEFLMQEAHRPFNLPNICSTFRLQFTMHRFYFPTRVCSAGVEQNITARTGIPR